MAWLNLISIMFNTISPNQESSQCDSTYTKCKNQAKLMYGVKGQESPVFVGRRVMAQVFRGSFSQWTFEHLWLCTFFFLGPNPMWLLLWGWGWGLRDEGTDQYFTKHYGSKRTTLSALPVGGGSSLGYWAGSRISTTVVKELLVFLRPGNRNIWN